MQSISEQQMKDWQEALTSRIGESVELDGRKFKIVAVHTRESKVVAPKTRNKPEAVRYPKHRTLARLLSL